MTGYEGESCLAIPIGKMLGIDHMGLRIRARPEGLWWANEQRDQSLTSFGSLPTVENNTKRGKTGIFPRNNEKDMNVSP